MSFIGGIWSGIKDTFKHLTGQPTDAERRAMNQQMKDYKNQTELTRQELARVKDQQIAEKRRIEEKQIRALRRNYSSQGFLGGSQSSQSDMSPKLGG
jgi:hypothetical protein